MALAVRIAADHDIPVTVRGGGHNVAGRSVADGALLVDLSRMRAVVVNERARVAVVQGGALWHDVDVATADAGLATTGGLVSSTGVGGLTLGGGTGWLMRRHGLAIDNLLAAGVVLADGRFVRASATENVELFYGLRGGAGRFGVVTSFEFQLHPLRQVLAGLIVRPAAEAADTLRVFRDFASAAPDEFCGVLVIAHAPPLPFLPASWHGRPVVISALCWCGEPGAGERALEPLHRFGSPLAVNLGVMPYVQWQHMLDGSAPAGRQQYWKNATFDRLSEATISVLASAANDLPTRASEIHVQHLGGAVARTREPETAFASRRAEFFVNLLGVTPWPEELGEVRERVRRLHDQLAPAALPGLLPNFTDLDDGDVTARLDGARAQRIGSLRRRYDPEGLFVSG
ncbi:MAG TPA: FAD-binding oxidoreductase [Steroidobacteraceae bacterium]|nr:FAD-binding oxidoreductase [Steroidobacteraceae bacterium]